MSILGNKIRNARENKNISIRELARKTNLDNSGVAKIENGKIRKPNIVSLNKICNELDLNLLEIANDAGYTIEELEQLKVIKISDYKGIKGTKKMQNYMFEQDNKKFIDIIEVLKGYKKNELSEAEVVGLLSICLGINVSKYSNPKTRKAYGIDNMIEK